MPDWWCAEVVFVLFVLVFPALDRGAVGPEPSGPAGPLLAAAVGFTTVAAIGQIGAGVVVRARRLSVPIAGEVALLLPVTVTERAAAGARRGRRRGSARRSSSAAC